MLELQACVKHAYLILALSFFGAVTESAHGHSAVFSAVAGRPASVMG